MSFAPLTLVNDAGLAVIVPNQSQFQTTANRWGSPPWDNGTYRHPPKIPNFRDARLDLSHMRAVASVCNYPMSSSEFRRFVPNSRTLDRDTLCIACACLLNRENMFQKQAGPFKILFVGTQTCMGFSPTLSSESSNCSPLLSVRIRHTQSS